MVSAETVMSVPAVQFQASGVVSDVGEPPPPPLQGRAGPAEGRAGKPRLPRPAGEGGASCWLQEWGFGLWEPNMEVAGCEGKLQVEA